MASKCHESTPPGPIPCKYPQGKPALELYDRIITIVVGPVGAEKSFPVYRQLLCSASKYFDNMLNGGFKESGSDTLKLADVDIKAFQHFFYWLNSGHIGCLDTSSDEPGVVCKEIIKAYAFADFHHVPRFKNALVDCMYNLVEQSSILFLYKFQPLFEITAHGDLMRKLVVDMTARSWSFDDLEETGSDFAQPFLFELMCMLKEHKITPGDKDFDRKTYRADMEAHFCERYHDHSTERNGKRTADTAFSSS